MFDISWGEFLVLIVAGLFILGPERLPGAAAWLGRTVRQMRQYASGAQQQLQKELGPEFDELRKPLQDLQQLRNFDPKRTVTRTLLDATGGYDPRDDLRLDDLRLGSVLGKDSVLGKGDGVNDVNDLKPNGYPLPARPVPQRPLAPGERPPFDPDAT
ncbi:MAG TPA: Sec-independent protein translocase protein TatB [Pseudonocardiaceae bacterium]|jgi:sec-independent protein translocase protein TatB|nr:Sec-independent protein translocase protein TatB [Pseudonocardiaceae bacterium]